MDIKKLKEYVLTNNIPKLLVFNAKNSCLAKQYLTSISNTLNKYHKYYNTADEVLYEITTNLREDYLYVILNDDKVIKNPTYIKELENTGRNIIVYFSEIDEQSSFYKTNVLHMVDFKPLDKYTILAYMQKQLEKNKIDVETSKLEKLIDYCNCDLGCCLNELDKIITLGQSNSNLLFEYMLQNGFSDYRKTDIFKFINKLLSQDKTVYDDAQRLDESFVGMLVLLYRNAKSKLTNTNNIRYADIMKLCYELDSCIKDGTLKDTYLLDYLMLKLV